MKELTQDIFSSPVAFEIGLIALCLCLLTAGCDRQDSGVQGEDQQFDITGGKATRVVWCLRRAIRGSRKGPWQVGYVVVVLARIIHEAA